MVKEQVKNGDKKYNKIELGRDGTEATISKPDLVVIKLKMQNSNRRKLQSIKFFFRWFRNKSQSEFRVKNYTHLLKSSRAKKHLMSSATGELIGNFVGESISCTKQRSCTGGATNGST